MEFEKTKSSYITAVGYDEPTKELRVQFKSGATWKYFAVPEAAHVSLILAESIGKYFAKEIKGVYSGKKVEEEDEE